MAVELSTRIDIPEISTRLSLHAERLLELGKVSDTIQLFRKAGCYKDAANILFQVKSSRIHSIMMLNVIDLLLIYITYWLD